MNYLTGYHSILNNNPIDGYLHKLNIPQNVIIGYSSFLNRENIPVALHNYYKKWLRYYLDYCHKYRFDYLNPGSRPHFLNKLKEKKQTGIQQKQAHESVGLFYELIKQKPDLKKEMSGFVNQKRSQVKTNEKPGGYREGFYQVETEVKELNREPYLAGLQGGSKNDPGAPAKLPETSGGETHCSWQNIFTGLENEIKLWPQITVGIHLAKRPIMTLIVQVSPPVE